MARVQKEDKKSSVLRDGTSCAKRFESGLNRLLFFLRSKRRGRDAEITVENGKGVVKAKIYRERQKNKLEETKRDFRVEFVKKIEAYKRKFSERRAWGYKYWEKKHGKTRRFLRRFWKRWSLGFRLEMNFGVLRNNVSGTYRQTLL